MVGGKDEHAGERDLGAEELDLLAEPVGRHLPDGTLHVLQCGLEQCDGGGLVGALAEFAAVETGRRGHTELSGDEVVGTGNVRDGSLHGGDALHRAPGVLLLGEGFGELQDLAGGVFKAGEGGPVRGGGRRVAGEGAGSEHDREDKEAEGFHGAGSGEEHSTSNAQRSTSKGRVRQICREGRSPAPGCGETSEDAQDQPRIDTNKHECGRAGRHLNVGSSASGVERCAAQGTGARSFTMFAMWAST